MTTSCPFLDPLQIRNPVKSEMKRRIGVGLIVKGNRTANINDKVMMKEGAGEFETINLG